MPSPFSFAFAEYTGGTVPQNVLNVGGLLIATGRTLSVDYSWWEGPNFQLGYVVARPKNNTQPTPIGGVFAGVGFWRSLTLTDASFVELANAVVPGQLIFERASQAATYFTEEEAYYVTWSSPITKILYSGQSYNNLWTSGDTSLATSIREVTYEYKETYLQLNLNINGNTAAYGTWELINRTLNPGDYPYSTLLVDIETFDTLNVEVFVTDGVTTVSNTNAGTGAETISVNISTLSSGFITCSIYAQRGCIACGNIQLNIYQVQLAQDTNIVTPYPYPNIVPGIGWTNMTLNETTPSYPFTDFQFKGLGNAGINITANYGENYCRVAYKITDSQIINFDTSTSPLSQGFSAWGQQFQIVIENNKWLSLSLYDSIEPGFENLTITNDDDFIDLATITIANE